jgi:DnaJ-class molecular chaperone
MGSQAETLTPPDVKAEKMNTTTEQIDCLLCDGHGTIQPAFHRSFPCYRCGGTGRIPAIHAEWRAKGQVLSDDRRARRVGHHEEAKRYGITASDLSDYEQGWRNPVELESEARDG